MRDGEAVLVERRTRLRSSSWARNMRELQVRVGGTEYRLLDCFRSPVIEEREGDVMYTIRKGDRLDSLASRFYRDPRLWWVIAQVNGMGSPVAGMQVGKVLRIPAPRYVSEQVVR